MVVACLWHLASTISNGQLKEFSFEKTWIWECGIVVGTHERVMRRKELYLLAPSIYWNEDSNWIELCIAILLFLKTFSGVGLGKFEFLNVYFPMCWYIGGQEKCQGLFSTCFTRYNCRVLRSQPLGCARLDSLYRGG